MARRRHPAEFFNPGVAVRSIHRLRVYLERDAPQAVLDDLGLLIDYLESHEEHPVQAQRHYWRELLGRRREGL